MIPGTSGSSCSFTQSFADQTPVYDKKGGRRRKKKSKMPAPSYSKQGKKFY